LPAHARVSALFDRVSGHRCPRYWDAGCGL